MHDISSALSLVTEPAQTQFTHAECLQVEAELESLTADLAAFSNDMKVLQARGYALANSVQRCMANTPSQSQTQRCEWEARRERLNALCALLTEV